MRFGIGSYSYHFAMACSGKPGCADFDIFTVLDHARRLGVDGVYIDAYHVGSLEPDHLRRIREAADERSLALELGFLGTDIDTLGPWMEAAVALGSPNLRTFVGRDRYNPPIEQQIAQAIQNLRETMKLAQDLGLRIAIENHMELKSTELLRIAAEVASPNLGFCLDTGNSMAVMEEPLDAATNLAPLAFMVHLKDARVTLVDDHARIHGVPFGEGCVPLAEIVPLLRPDCSVWLESLVVEGETSAATCAAEAAAVDHAVRYSREKLGL